LPNFITLGDEKEEQRRTDKMVDDHKAIFLKLVTDLHIYSHKNLEEHYVIPNREANTDTKNPKGT
jgi:hypothetical protein